MNDAERMERRPPLDRFEGRERFAERLTRPSADHVPQTQPVVDFQRPGFAPPPRTLADVPQQHKGFQRAVGVVRSALPLVQRILPLLDGNVASAVAGLLSGPPPPPPAPVDLRPIEASLAELQNRHRDLHTLATEQGSSLLRVEEQIEALRDAVARQSQAQGELQSDQKALRGRTRFLLLISLLILLLAGASVALNVVLLLHFRHLHP